MHLFNIFLKLFYEHNKYIKIFLSVYYLSKNTAYTLNFFLT